jgi:hypothetical protein
MDTINCGSIKQELNTINRNLIQSRGEDSVLEARRSKFLKFLIKELVIIENQL